MRLYNFRELVGFDFFVEPSIENKLIKIKINQKVNVNRFSGKNNDDILNPSPLPNTNPQV